jgi:hypothetical protein
MFLVSQRIGTMTYSNDYVCCSPLLEIPISAIEKSFDYIKEAINNNENTGWYALTPKDQSF